MHKTISVQEDQLSQGSYAPTVGARSRSVNEFVATYIMGLANRLSSGASSHYRRIWNIGMTEWRVLVAARDLKDVIIRDIAVQADLDESAASRSINMLRSRGLVEVKHTRLRGRPTLVNLTEEGIALHDQIRASALFRQARLLSPMTKSEIDMLMMLLGKLETGITLMNEPAPDEQRTEEPTREL